MVCKNWPASTNPEPGDIVSICILSDEGEFVYECEARLIEKLDNWRQSEPVPVRDITPHISINAVKSRWKVEIVSDNVFDNGRKMVRWVYSFHSIGRIKIKELEEKETEDLLDDTNLIV